MPCQDSKFADFFIERSDEAVFIEKSVERSGGAGSEKIGGAEWCGYPAQILLHGF